ncbi:uncharacterized protein LOC131892081 isoform X1 [Tigriopus californicus]|uniref:uncharacterized protein LOC131892081 isoform X1 n=1 Tax=Tigriopus californicus TaxID=6832 RepID=UPI0027DA3B83|nr:uncharacterized protein LOC131892081 isoform X1 [Tigriopus californicus]
MAMINTIFANLVEEAKAASAAASKTAMNEPVAHLEEPRGVVWGQRGEHAQTPLAPGSNDLAQYWNVQSLFHSPQTWLQLFRSLQHQSFLKHFKNQYEAQETRVSMPQPLSEDQLHDLVGRLVPDPSVFAQGVPVPEESVKPITVQEEHEYVVVGTTRARRKNPSSPVYYIVDEQDQIVVNPVTGKRWAFCPICPKVFEDESSVYRHDDIHKSERHQCPLCDRSSVQRYVHPDIHLDWSSSPIAGSNVHFCSHSRYNLRIHMETHIGMDVPKVVKDMLPNDFRGVIDGNAEFINPARFRRKLVRTLKKRIKATTCMQTVQSLQSKLLSLEHGNP